MILIKNVQIVDGSGQKPFRGDILIDKNKISAIQPVINKKADEVFDGLGLTAVPGFIDVNTNSDHYLSLFTYPAQKDFLLQGVTTIVGGQCGASLAPLMYGSLVSIRKWAKSDLINVGWNKVSEFLDALRRIKIGVNFATLVGHSTIRRDIVGEQIRDLTQSELDVFLKILNDSLNEGAIGLSTGLAYIHSRFVPYSEIRNLVKLVAKQNKLYTSHLRDEKNDLLKSVEETIGIAQETGARTVITHFRPFRGLESQFEQALALIDQSLAKANVYFDVNPFGKSIIAIYALLPEWAQNGGIEVMMNHLLNENTREKIAEELSKKDLGGYVIGAAIGQERLVGKSLKALANDREKTVTEILLELMINTKLRGKLTLEDLNTELVEKKLLFHPRSLIGSNSASLPEKIQDLVKMERANQTFSRYLDIAANHNTPLEETIKKITSLAAQVTGIKNRGYLKEKYAADIVLLKENKVTDVLVNGKFAVRNSALTNELAGDVIQVL
jgi:N-acyl-D-amino-acid deacylase